MEEVLEDSRQYPPRWYQRYKKGSLEGGREALEWVLEAMDCYEQDKNRGKVEDEKGN